MQVRRNWQLRAVYSERRIFRSGNGSDPFGECLELLAEAFGVGVEFAEVFAAPLLVEYILE